MSQSISHKKEMIEYIITALKEGTKPVVYFGQFPDSDVWYNSIKKNKDTKVCLAEDVIKLDLADPQKLTNEDISNIQSWVSWSDVCVAFNPTTISGGSLNLPNCKTLNLITIYSDGARATLDTEFFTITAITQQIKNEWEAVLDTPNGIFIVPIKEIYNSVNLTGFIADAVRRSNIYLR